MDPLQLAIGFLIGAIISYLIFYVLHQAKSVKRSVYDEQAAKLQTASEQLKIHEERHNHHIEAHETLKSKFEERESLLVDLRTRNAFLEATLKANEAKLSDTNQQILHLTEQNMAHQKEANILQKSVAELTAVNTSLNEKLATQKTDFEAMQKTAQLQFEKIAQQIFEEKSGKFTEANKSNIEALLKPLNENINTFKKKVEETYDKESKQRFSLEEKVKDLIQNTQKISQEANNLASALKGHAKKQGDWGETILERILELSGLVKNREYFVQGNIKDEHGNNLRPDIMVRLPDERVIIIDSKVSLNAYVRHSEADTKEVQDIEIANHLRSINQHIDQLSSKKYDELATSLDFVIMFVPIEPAYALAIQSDPELWAYAYTRRILLISPTNLIAVLKIIADLWQREAQSKNAQVIASEGAKLYDKFVGFISSFEEIGKHLSKSQESYEKAVGQLKDGRGNLIAKVEKLRKLGVKSTKQPTDLMLSADKTDEEEQEDSEQSSDTSSNPAEKT